jgi:hypothetical protein
MRTTALFVLVSFWAFAEARAQASVQITNLSHPATKIEVGNVIGIFISNAAANSPVTFTIDCCGGGPYGVGSTDNNGNFSLTTNPMTSNDVATYEEHWYVGGVEVQPLNVSTSDFPFAPQLPVFTVYQNYSGGSNCSSMLLDKWEWTPLIYGSATSLLSGSAVNAAAAEWNWLQSFIQISDDNTNGRQDINIFDAINPMSGTLAETGSSTQELNPACHRKLGLGCISSVCLTASSTYYVSIAMNATEIPSYATLWGMSTADLAYNILLHEKGHALRLQHPAISGDGRCSAAQDIMEGSTSVRIGCGISSPNFCSYVGLHSGYGTVSPASCPLEMLYCDANSSC